MVSIIAIHGLNGHPFRTWTIDVGGGNQVFWLGEILPKRLPNTKIKTYGYNSKVLSPSKSSIDDDAKEFLSFVAAGRTVKTQAAQWRLWTALIWKKTVETPILFIAHSLGGLVLKQVRRPHRSNSKWSYSKIFLPQALSYAKVNAVYSSILSSRKGIAFMGKRLFPAEYPLPPVCSGS